MQTEVSVGDEVLVKGNGGLVPAKVVNVSSLIMQGDYSFSFLLNIIVP